VVLLNLQPKIRAFFRKAAEQLRKQPSDIRQAELDLLVEANETPWGPRHERAIKDVFDPEAADP
jgi:hypothetical protein